MSSVPVKVQKEFELYRQKTIGYRTVTRKAYDAMMNRFIKYGLYVRTPRGDALLKKNLPKEEYLKRQRAYMKKWRSKNPKYQVKKMKNKDINKNKQVQTLQEKEDQKKLSK